MLQGRIQGLRLGFVERVVKQGVEVVDQKFRV